MDLDWKAVCETASEVVEATIGDLPKTLGEKVRQLPITFERKPNAGLQGDGIEMDTLGVFTGAELAEEGRVPMPPQIILFLENILDQAEGDQNGFREEIRTTFLHELGHFLGLDEDDLRARGLE